MADLSVLERLQQREAAQDRLFQHLQGYHQNLQALSEELKTKEEELLALERRLRTREQAPERSSRLHYRPEGRELLAENRLEAVLEAERRELHRRLREVAIREERLSAIERLAPQVNVLPSPRPSEDDDDYSRRRPRRSFAAEPDLFRRDLPRPVISRQHQSSHHHAQHHSQHEDMSEELSSTMVSDGSTWDTDAGTESVSFMSLGDQRARLLTELRSNDHELRALQADLAARLGGSGVGGRGRDGSGGATGVRGSKRKEEQPSHVRVDDSVEVSSLLTEPTPKADRRRQVDRNSLQRAALELEELQARARKISQEARAATATHAGQHGRRVEQEADRSVTISLSQSLVGDVDDDGGSWSD